MTRYLQRQGDTYALVFDETMMEALNLTPETPLNIAIAGGSMVITAANEGVSATELDEAIAKLRPRYKTMLENLPK